MQMPHELHQHAATQVTWVVFLVACKPVVPQQHRPSWLLPVLRPLLLPPCSAARPTNADKGKTWATPASAWAGTQALEPVAAAVETPHRSKASVDRQKNSMAMPTPH
mmetsp:Transcript_76970/g.200193  ORF Transcript_76970/g.200193 Transcript_76970/m.200193 type:complete len:107 (+) Transcript_76970:1553-1873(+)